VLAYPLDHQVGGLREHCRSGEDPPYGRPPLGEALLIGAATIFDRCDVPVAVRLQQVAIVLLVLLLKAGVERSERLELSRDLLAEAQNFGSKLIEAGVQPLR
jgi:hypothetical protein